MLNLIRGLLYFSRLPIMKSSDQERAITVLLASARPTLRAALSTLINTQPDLKVTAEAATQTDILAHAATSGFDVIVVVFNVAAGLGLNCLEQVRTQYPKVPIVVMNLSPSDHDALTIIRMELAAYLGRRSEPAHLFEALRRAVKGQRFISPAVAEQLVFQLSVTSDEAAEGVLTPRERQVLTLIAQGIKRREIAETLRLSPQTVSTYRSRLLEKLGLKTNAQLVRYAVDEKLV
jgi:DNA-binding NarL/FixJ family response regulator